MIGADEGFELVSRSMRLPRTIGCPEPNRSTRPWLAGISDILISLLNGSASTFREIGNLKYIGSATGGRQYGSLSSFSLLPALRCYLVCLRATIFVTRTQKHHVRRAPHQPGRVAKGVRRADCSTWHNQRRRAQRMVCRQDTGQGLCRCRCPTLGLRCESPFIVILTRLCCPL